MIRLEEWVDIVSMRKAGVSISEIARELGISRNTVKATLRRDGPPEYHRRRKPSKLDPYKPYLLERLREFPELSARRLFDEISAQGYEGKISILKDFTREHRVPRKRTIVRFETPPGEQAQCDYAELGVHEVRSVPTKVYAFTMLLGFSRYLYVEFSDSCASDAFLAAHARAFTRVLSWLEDEANIRDHGTTGVPPAERLPLEGLTPVSEALPWVPSRMPAPLHAPNRPVFRFETAPPVEVRPLTVYEEVCS